MFNVGLGEIAVILVLGLLIFGPDRLPRAVQTVAGGLRRFRQVANEATRSLQDAAGWDDQSTRQALTDLADLHPRRLAGSVLDDRPPASPAPRAPARQRPAAPDAKTSAPLVDFDPDAP